MASQFHNLAVKLTNLLLDGIACFQQRSDGSYQFRTALDQLFGSHGKDIELGTADYQAEIFEKATNMVLEIALDLDQQRRLASSALTEWLSISLTCTFLNQPVCMMRAIPIASLRSLLLICILSTALA